VHEPARFVRHVRSLDGVGPGQGAFLDTEPIDARITALLSLCPVSGWWAWAEDLISGGKGCPRYY
jgi:hypothetical protein